MFSRLLLRPLALFLHRDSVASCEWAVAALRCACGGLAPAATEPAVQAQVGGDVDVLDVLRIHPGIFSGVSVDADGVLRRSTVNDPTGQLTRQRVQESVARLDSTYRGAKPIA